MPPDDWPNMVTTLGFPPKAAIFLLTNFWVDVGVGGREGRGEIC